MTTSFQKFAWMADVEYLLTQGFTNPCHRPWMTGMNTASSIRVLSASRYCFVLFSWSIARLASSIVRNYGP